MALLESLIAHQCEGMHEEGFKCAARLDKCELNSSNTRQNGSKMGGLTGVTPRENLRTGQGSGGGPTYTPSCSSASPSWASSCGWQDGSPTCAMQHTYSAILHASVIKLRVLKTNKC